MGKSSAGSTSESKITLRPVIGLVQHLHPSDLEGIVADEIRKYRRLTSEASRLYEGWQAGQAARTGEDQVSEAEKAYIAAMIAQQAQQTVVSTLLDVLGYVPEVAPACSH